VVVQVGSLDVSALIDTGASRSIIHPDLFNQLDGSKKTDLEHTGVVLTVANGAPVSVDGRSVVELRVDGGPTLRHEFLVAPLGPGLILGFDFLVRFDCVIDARERKLQIRGEGAGTASRVTVRACETVEIPPGHEVVLRGEYREGLQSSGGQTMLLEADERLAEQRQLLVARVLIRAEGGQLPVRIANVSQTPQTLYKDTVLGSMEEIVVVHDEPKTRASDKAKSANLPPLLEELWQRDSTELTNQQKEKFRNFLEQDRHVFITGKGDLGRTSLYPHRIFTGDAAAVKQPPRRFPRSKRQAAEDEIQRMLDMGVIEPSDSPWASPVVLVTKRDGSLRFCVDYRHLNEVTRKDSFPLPKIDDTLQALEGSVWFSTLDLASGYWQVEMDPDDAPKTAFTTERGLWQFKVLPMGLCNAGATFQRLMQMVFRGLDWRVLLIYLDDLIVHSKTFDEHLVRLREVFHRLQTAGLKLTPKKCRLFQRQVTFLGHVVSGAGIQTDSTKTDAVTKWPTPKSVRDVRAFLGFCGYYRRFVRGFAEIARPLHRLTEKNAEFRWTTECHNAMEALKKALSSTPLLAYPQDHGDFILDTDASGTAIGAVLSQRQNDEERVILYYSRGLSKAERNYCVTRRELLAVLEAIKHCRHYLLGCHFTVRTDHGALRWLLNFKRPEGQVARWLEVLGSYDFKIEHRAGIRHGNADGLSRRPCNPECKHCQRQEDREVTEVRAVTTSHSDALKPPPAAPAAPHAVPEDEAWHPRMSVTELRQKQAADPALGQVHDWLESRRRPPWQEAKNGGPDLRIYWSIWDQLTLQDGVVVRKVGDPLRATEVRIIAPMELRHNIFQQLHLTRLGGHQGVQRTAANIRQRFWWPRQRADVNRWCQECDTCQRRGLPPGPGRAPLQQDLAAYPMERLAMDILSLPTASDDGNTCLLVVCDYYSKYCWTFALPDHTALTVADALVTGVFLPYGLPQILHSDQGREFQSELIRELCRLLQIRQTRTAPYRPQSDGLVERMNRTLLDMLAKLSGDHPEDWDNHLPYAVSAFNATAHASTGCSPNLLMFGREVTLPVDLVYGTLPVVPDLCPVEYVEWVKNTMAKNYAKVREHMGRAAERQRRVYNKSAVLRVFQRGDWVLRFFPPRARNKLSAKYVGPYLVLERLGEVSYKVQRSRDSTPMVVHVDQLKAYRSSHPPRSWLPALDHRNIEGEGRAPEDPLAQHHREREGRAPRDPLAHAEREGRAPEDQFAHPVVPVSKSRPHRARQPPARFKDYIMEVGKKKGKRGVRAMIHCPVEGCTYRFRRSKVELYQQHVASHAQEVLFDPTSLLEALEGEGPSTSTQAVVAGSCDTREVCVEKAVAGPSPNTQAVPEGPRLLEVNMEEAPAGPYSKIRVVVGPSAGGCCDSAAMGRQLQGETTSPVGQRVPGKRVRAKPAETAVLDLEDGDADEWYREEEGARKKRR
jgi:hypothetical protein